MGHGISIRAMLRFGLYVIMEYSVSVRLVFIFGLVTWGVHQGFPFTYFVELLEIKT